MADGYVGSAACKTCHADIWFNFYKNPHYKSVASGDQPPELTGCEGCHGPGKAHVDARGGKTTIPRAFSLMEPIAVLDTCLHCHAGDFQKTNIRRSQHSLADVVCTNCHSIHKPATPQLLLAKKQAELCYGCHSDVRAQFSMPFKHRVNEGFVNCTDCHNPHGSFAPDAGMAESTAMTTRAGGNQEACLKCHADKRGPFAYEHPPVRVEGCGVCHVPHGSTNAKLLVRPVVFTLCLRCHNGADSLGTRNNGVPALSNTHNMLDPRYQRCTLCHVRIHGSNSDGYFFR
ncbi:MAG TPA: DmsE family decaheme c-type cytochrome [Bryobacteraceae bacterium]|nr:DmsE family decaheme c-type cytochrome [Bryobacteraceae bacterium]